MPGISKQQKPSKKGPGGQRQEKRTKRRKANKNGGQGARANANPTQDEAQARRAAVNLRCQPVLADLEALYEDSDVELQNYIRRSNVKLPAYVLAVNVPPDRPNFFQRNKIGYLDCILVLIILAMCLYCVILIEQIYLKHKYKAPEFPLGPRHIDKYS